MRKLKFGVLGGTRGMDYATRVLFNHPLAEVAAICENYQPLKEKLEQENKTAFPNLKIFSDYDEFLESGIDAVVLANFANEHAPYAIKALLKGVNVFSESLPTQTMKEAVELVEAVEKSGKFYAYGENYCYLPHTFEMRKIYDSGVLGEVMHAEGNFINDCSFKWHLLTRGNRAHWRNFVPSTFYCTHSIGPMLFSTGRRAVSVSALETQRMEYMAKVGARSGSAAMEIMQLDNGGMAKSSNGNFRRAYNAEYRLICENGTIETDIYDWKKLRLFKANEEKGGYDLETLDPQDVYKSVLPDVDFKGVDSFKAADKCMMNIFINTLLGDEVARKYAIDVYKALDMSMVGLLAYRSILNGGSVEVPDLRKKEERDKFRFDNKCTDEKIASGEELLPPNRDGFPEVEDSVYEAVSATFKNTTLTSGGH